MCWSPVATGIFASLYFISGVSILIRKPSKWVELLVFTSFYMIMELFQLFQWTLGDVTMIANETSILNGCSGTNQGFTYVAWALIWLQPLMFSSMGLYSNLWGSWKGKKSYFLKITLMNLVIFFYAIITLISINLSNVNYGATDPDFDSNVGLITCTFIGKNSHLQWVIKSFHPDYQVNNLLYVILCLISFINYDGELLGIALSWLLTFFVTIICFNVSLSEIPAFWCMLSIGSVVINTIYSFVYSYANYEPQKLGYKK